MGRAIAFDELPESVRSAAIAMAAEAIGRVPAAALPRIVKPLARFTPSKRARSGSVPLSRVLATDAGFRALIAGHLTAPGDDPVVIAAHRFLTGHPDLERAVADVEAVDEIAALRARIAELTAVVDALSARLANATVVSAPAPDPEHHVLDGLAGEVEKLRGRLREQGSRHRVALDRAKAVSDRTAADRDRAVADRDRAVATAERLRVEVRALTERLDAESRRAASDRAALGRVRRESDRDRAAADRRSILLLDTLAAAAAGLRSEWRLRGGGALPADTVAARLPDQSAASSRPADAALLLQWLALPHAHLVVDGYNVTKTGYPELTLAEQRDRLVRSLGVVAARTGCEITAVFDGAAIIATTPSARGVRVVFSPAGVIADDVIRELVAAEPVGRVVIVVTSDREIVDWMRGRRVRTASSPVLLELG